ncbi:MAG: adenosylcobinamide-phosphate synthase CbiB [Pseudomonadota bacterium]
MNAPALMLLAWGLEVVIGWPDWLYKRIRHPVVWVGALISAFEKTLNRQTWPHQLRYLAGVITTLIIVATTTGVAIGISTFLPNTLAGLMIEALVASSLIASRSLYAHIAAVARPMAAGDVDSARKAVSMIVGRDPDLLDESGLARASLESLAENASDGVIAPIFWGAILGLPGLAAYKAVNTLDSMIGHRNERCGAFGGFAARLDDIANLIPARITGGLIAAAGFGVRGFRIMITDARRHRSPNAGWPEAAMAGALNVRLSGPRTYGGEKNNEPWLNEVGRDPTPSDINAGLGLYMRAMGLAAMLLALIASALVWGNAS